MPPVRQVGDQPEGGVHAAHVGSGWLGEVAAGAPDRGQDVHTQRSKRSAAEATAHHQTVQIRLEIRRTSWMPPAVGRGCVSPPLAMLPDSRGFRVPQGFGDVRANKPGAAIFVGHGTHGVLVEVEGDPRLFMAGPR